MTKIVYHSSRMAIFVTDFSLDVIGSQRFNQKGIERFDNSPIKYSSSCANSSRAEPADRTHDETFASSGSDEISRKFK
jgi:hypothetical protein